jgi:putative copper export protein
MAHEGLAAFMVILGVLLLLAYYLGPKNEARLRKRREGQVMLIPSAIILFFLAVVVFSGVLG